MRSIQVKLPMSSGISGWLIAMLLCGCSWALQAVETAVITVDFSRTNGFVRALHGINKGPIAFGGIIDLTQPLKELKTPFTRLHDCQWPYPDVVDMHAIFRDGTADPTKPGSYDFVLTDDYLAATAKTGARIVYRLGESIEHGTVKRFVHPPADCDRWSEACLGIIRHYNQGWKDGFHYNIDYWEIWNEPENRPAMWTGSDDDYFRLYSATAQKIKKVFPNLKVGGPAVGYSGSWDDGVFIASGFVTNFLQMCRRESVPLDFFSWHCYASTPQEFVSRAKAIRLLLDSYGFASTQSHLNEWNYLPGDDWSALSRDAAPSARAKYYSQMHGPAGAAFVIAALAELQDAPVDVCNFYHGEIGPFGLFDENGVPNHVYHALRGFAELAGCPRIPTSGVTPRKVSVLGGTQGKKHQLLLSNTSESAVRVVLNSNPAAPMKVLSIKDCGASGWCTLPTPETALPGSPLALEMPAKGILRLELLRD